MKLVADFIFYGIAWFCPCVILGSVGYGLYRMANEDDV